MRKIIAAGSAAAAVTGAAWLWKHQGEVLMSRPLNEWTFTHMNRLLRTETVTRAPQLGPLPRRGQPFDVEYEFAGRRHTLADLHQRTHTTGFLVLHGGAVVREEYPGRFASPTARFQWFSVTKSVTSMMIGIALEQGRIGSIDDPVVRYCPDLVGTPYEPTTIADLLDMCSGVGDLEDWTVDDAVIRRFERAVLGGGSILEVIRSAPTTTLPGTSFNYSTIDSHVLGWVLEGAVGTSLAAYATAQLWEPIGAEADGYYFLSRGRPRTALGGGSLNATLRDMARIGLVMARDGRVGNRQIVPSAWVGRSRGTDRPHLAVGSLGPSGYDHYGYANQWWTLGGPRRSFTGLGIHGQFLWVDPDSDTVIAKTSAWPTADDPERDAETVAAMRAIVGALAGSQ